MALVEVRLEDFLEYDAPSSSSSPPSRPPVAGAVSQQPAPRPTADASDLSYTDLCQLILVAAQEQQTQQEVEAFYNALVGELRRRQQEEVPYGHKRKPRQEHSCSLSFAPNRSSVNVRTI
ncbi:hypothetical protein PV04_02891 [Phialophora macrospora]|uniref:Uncharacterized protein n=1 Tax=Phialophora macrospora TaxID=1851006 RepID=A0A0D2CZJ2_9EURO|nr:hypothetical protein PV04_02891 [Phialophora macrospora]